MFLREKLFLQLIPSSEDKKQKFQIIKCINHNQYFELKKITINILQGVLPLKKDQLKYLKNSKTLIRKLAEGKVTNNYLATHYMIISYIVKIALEYNEKHTKTRTSSNRKVGKIRPKRTCKRNFSENSSSEGSIISEETNFSSEESTGSRNTEKDDDSSEVSSVISDKEE